jgi:hypothetical protein
MSVFLSSLVKQGYPWRKKRFQIIPRARTRIDSGGKRNIPAKSPMTYVAAGRKLVRGPAINASSRCVSRRAGLSRTQAGA